MLCWRAFLAQEAKSVLKWFLPSLVCENEGLEPEVWAGPCGCLSVERIPVESRMGSGKEEK